MSKRGNNFPYKPLGSRLKRMRENSRESLAEVSGAVEIEIDALNSFEQGLERPSEDILLLLISHFGAGENEATKLWELAAYDQQQMPFVNMAGNNDDQTRMPVAVTPQDAKINYTDMVHVMVNDYGVVMNFMQGNGPGSQPMIVSRIGMSREHAKSVLEILQKTMAKSEPKSLPAPGVTGDNQAKS